MCSVAPTTAVYQLATRSVAQLASHSYCSRIAEKIVRKPFAKEYYRHPIWVMQREKILSTIWQDQAVFKYSLFFLLPFFTVAKYFQA